jgi:hypothetical protein
MPSGQQLQPVHSLSIARTERLQDWRRLRLGELTNGGASMTCSVSDSTAFLCHREHNTWRESRCTCDTEQGMSAALNQSRVEVLNVCTGCR